MRRRAFLSGSVSVGLAPYSTTSILSLSLLKEVKRQHPEIMLHINDNFGSIFSELVMNGRMDMALIYGSRADAGRQFPAGGGRGAVPDLASLDRRSQRSGRRRSLGFACRRSTAVAEPHTPASNACRCGVHEDPGDAAGGRRNRVHGDAGNRDHRGDRLDHPALVGGQSDDRLQTRWSSGRSRIRPSRPPFRSVFRTTCRCRNPRWRCTTSCSVWSGT